MFLKLSPPARNLNSTTNVISHRPTDYAANMLLQHVCVSCRAPTSSRLRPRTSSWCSRGTCSTLLKEQEYIALYSIEEG